MLRFALPALAAAALVTVPLTLLPSANSADATPAAPPTCKTSGHYRCPPPSPSPTSPAPSPTGTTSSPTPTATSASPSPSDTSPSPNPTGTSPSPSPTGTGTATACVTSDPKGTCGPYPDPAISTNLDGDPWVSNNMWNPISGASVTLTATAADSWSVAANMPAGNTAVVAYEGTSENVNWINGTEPKLSHWSSITSAYTESMPDDSTGTIGEAAYDIWLNNWANEVMIQNDFRGENTRPRCGSILTTQTFGGSNGVPAASWDLCQFGSELIWQPPPGVNIPAGNVDILGMLTWLENNGGGKYLPANSGLTQLNYGFEVCSTGGQPQNFSVSQLTITANL